MLGFVALVLLPCSLQAKELRVESQPLENALIFVAESFHLKIVFFSEETDGLEVEGFVGQFSAPEAFERLLHGTSLEHVFVSRTSVVVRRISPAARERGSDSMSNADKKSGLVRALMSLFTAAAVGANAAAESTSVDARQNVIEEVVVTAVKRKEGIQDIPIAISALSGETLSRRGVSGLLDLQKQTPSLQIGNDGHQVFVTMRGIGSEVANIGAASGVSFSQDGVVYGRNVLFDANFLDVDRVEIVRGPQGTINGRNATGGAVHVHSNLPGESFEAAIKGTVANYDRRALEGYVNGALGDRLYGRLAFKVDHADGWIDNRLLDEEYEDRDKTHVRASFLTPITDSFEALLIIDSIQDDSIRQGTFSDGRSLPGVPSFAETSGVPQIDADDLEFEGDSVTDSDKEQLSLTLQMTWDISPRATLTSTTGYIDYELTRAYDCDGTSLSVCGFSQLDFEVEQFSQELTLTADLSDDVDLILGGLYLTDDSAEPANFFSEEFVGLPPDLFVVTPKQELTSYAIYSQIRYAFAENWQLSVGARYTEDEKDYEEVPPAGSIVGPIGPASDSWDDITPRIAIDYTPTDDLTVYASAAKGFKAGGYNAFAAELNVFDPEEVWSYELGFKAKWLDDTLRVAGAGFFMDYQDLQQNVFGLGGGFLPRILNSGEAEIKGIELEVEATLGEHWRFNFAGTWLDAEFTELRTADNIQPELGVVDPTTGLNVRDLSGNPLPRAPELQINTGIEYETNLSNFLILSVGVDYSWRDDATFTIYNRDTSSQDSYGLLNAFINLQTTDGRWDITAFGQNLEDERYVLNRSETAAGLAPVADTRSSFGAPRMYGISVEYRI